MPYLDTCDRCLTEDSPAIAPVKLTPTSPGQLQATYRCPTCGSIWTCSWTVQAEEEPA
jgi:hypothetical protein